MAIALGFRLMECGESRARETHESYASRVPVAKQIESEEQAHELADMVDQERLHYIGAVVGAATTRR